MTGELKQSRYEEGTRASSLWKTTRGESGRLLALTSAEKWVRRNLEGTDRSSAVHNPSYGESKTHLEVKHTTESIEVQVSKGSRQRGGGKKKALREQLFEISFPAREARGEKLKIAQFG